MSFLSPFFLFAVAAVGLPVLIHLLNIRKPQRVRFSTLAFFRELQKTTIRRIRIKKLLLLALRALAIACLAMVLARPFMSSDAWSGGEGQSPALIAVLIDNSISMEQIGAEGPLLDQAKRIAQTIEGSSKDNDRFILQVSNGEELYPAVIGHSQFTNRLDELSISKGGTFMKERLQALQELLLDAPYQQKKIFLVTDGQRHVLDEIPEQWPEELSVTMIKLDGASPQNSRVTEIQTRTNMISAGLPVILSVKVENLGNSPVTNQFVSMQFNDKPAGEYVLGMDAGSGSTVDFEVIPTADGANNGVVTIEGDEFTADNQYYFSVEVPESRNVLWVTDGRNVEAGMNYMGLILEAAAENNVQFRYQKAGAGILGDPELASFDAVILDGLSEVPAFAFSRLTDFVQRGNGLLFLPSEKGNISNYNDLLSQFNMGSFSGISGEYASFKPIAKVSELEYDHPIFRGLFDKLEDEQVNVEQPDVFYYYRFSPSVSAGGFTLIRLNTGDPMVREKRFGSGKVMVSAIGDDPSWSNFALKSLYAPFFYQTIMYASSSEQGGLLTHELGSLLQWTGVLNASETQIVTKNGAVVPEVSLSSAGTVVQYDGQEWSPGFIQLTDGDHSYSIALNLPASESPQAADSQTTDPDPFEGRMVNASGLDDNQLQTTIRESGFGREIWVWFMWAGMFFLVLEVLVSVFFKAEAIQQQS